MQKQYCRKSNPQNEILYNIKGNRNERKKATKFILTVPCNYIQMIKAPYKASDQLRLKPLICEFASGLELLN